MNTNYTYGFLISETILEGITLPYNTPDVFEEPNLYLDMTAYSDEINPTSKNLEKDVFDNTFWQSKQINAVIMPWLPYFSNC